MIGPIILIGFMFLCCGVVACLALYVKLHE